MKLKIEVNVDVLECENVPKEYLQDLFIDKLNILRGITFKEQINGKYTMYRSNSMRDETLLKIKQNFEKILIDFFVIKQKLPLTHYMENRLKLSNKDGSEPIKITVEDKQ